MNPSKLYRCIANHREPFVTADTFLRNVAPYTPKRAVWAEIPPRKVRLEGTLVCNVSFRQKVPRTTLSFHTTTITGQKVQIQLENTGTTPFKNRAKVPCKLLIRWNTPPSYRLLWKTAANNIARLRITLTEPVKSHGSTTILRLSAMVKA